MLLVEHNLGCLAVAALPFPLHAKVAGSLRVAPADVERPNASPAIAASVLVPTQPLSFQSVVVSILMRMPGLGNGVKGSNC